MTSSNLSVGAIGDEVRELHLNLRRQGFEVPVSEVERGFFGPATREAVRGYQRQRGFKVTGVVDAATRDTLRQPSAAPASRQSAARAAAQPISVAPRPAAHLAGPLAQPAVAAGEIPEGEKLVVRGHVVYKEGLLIEGVTVRAYNRDLRHEDFLGEAVTDREGRYEIAYLARQFSRPEKKYADLILRVYDLREGTPFTGNEDEKPIAESDIVFGAQPVEKVKLVVDGGVRNAWSEYEQIMDELPSLLGDTPITSLTEDAENQDITFLAGQADLDPHNIARIVWAHNLAAKTDLPPEVFYGFARQNLPLTLPELLAQSQEAQRAALEGAVFNYIIPGRILNQIDEILKRLRELIVEQAFEAPREEGRASLAGLLSTVLPAKDVQAQFISAYVGHTGPMKSFWEDLRAQPEFKERVEDLQLTIQLGALTSNNLPLTQELQAIRQKGDFSSLRDLARLDTDGWRGLIDNTAVGGKLAVPPEIQGRDDDEKARNYAATMTRMVADAFPTEVLAYRLQKDDAPERAELRTFFNNVLKEDTGFELGRTSISKFLNDNPQVLADVSDRETVEAQLKGGQRLMRLAPGAEGVLPLMEQGFDSALAVTRLGESSFLAQVANTIDETTARRVYARAEYVTAAALNLFGNFNTTLNGVGMKVLPWKRPAVEGVPDWETLFGSLDLCACEHCRSVHGPAAYFVELLAWLSERKSKVANLSVRDVLFRRRPDLGEIELTCENTSTPVPYVDLVNEVLENAVAPFMSLELPASLEPELMTGPLSPGVRTAFLGWGIDFGPDAAVVVAHPGSRWFVTDHAMLYSIKRQDGRLEVVSRCAQTSGPERELLANPQHLNHAAYRKLREAVFPLNLPFDLWAAEARAFLTHLGVPRHELMRVFFPQGESAALTDHAVAAEYLGLTSREWQLIADTLQPTSPTWDLWGLRETGNEVPSLEDPTVLVSVGWLDVLRRVRFFLDRAHISYEQMIELLKTRFVNPGSRITVVSADPEDPTTCDTTRLVLAETQVGILEPALRRVVRFVRLWRASGWTIAEVDMALTALRGGAADVDSGLSSTFLVQLSHLKRLQELVDLAVERLLTLWGPIDTYGDNSFYARLFQNPAVFKPVDPAFKLDDAELAVVSTAPDDAKINKHVPTILAALGISEQDLVALKGTEVTDDALTLANLTRLLRVVVLAKGLRMPVSQVLAIKTLTGVNPFDASHTENTLRFVEIIEMVRVAGFTPAELAYLLQHTISETAPVAPDDATIGLILDDVRVNLQNIQAENELDADPNGELTRKKLALLRWEPSLIEQAISTLKGTVSYETSLAALPDGIVFPESIRSRISYDGSARRLVILGPMSQTDQTALLGASGEPAYQTAIRALFRMPRDFVSGKMKAFDLPVFSVPLAQLPAGVAFPAAWRNRIYLDTQAKEAGVPHSQLRFVGMMTDKEREQLLTLSADAAYVEAINALYAKPASYVPDESNAFLSEADAAWMFDAARTSDDRFERLLARLLPYLRARLSASMVKQKLGEVLRLESRMVDEFLTRQITAPSDASKPIIDEFLEPRFAQSSLALGMTRAEFRAQFDAFTRLYKAAMLATRFRMTSLQLSWLHEYGAMAGWLNLNDLPLAPTTSVALFVPWERLAGLFALRDALPGGDSTLDHVLAMARDGAATVDAMLAELSKLTGWSKADLDMLATRLQVQQGAAGISMSERAAYVGEGALLRLCSCAGLIKRLGTSAARGIEWTKADLTDGDVAEILRAAKAKYEEEQWLDVARPVRDTIRDQQRQALVAYLLAQPDPDAERRLRWTDADDLFQYYLIDMEMSPCMVTSRIKQAISSAQIFVQRCLLNLEPQIKADETQDARWRDWKWMKNYRVWEANRRIFLYPENWIEPELRDDKSPFFRDLENQLLQNEITQETAEEAFLQYLEKLDVVARLEIVGMYHQQDDGGSTDILHVFGRTRQSPHLYYYRRRLASGRWTAWEKVDLDIEGDHLIPVVWNRRLYLFWPIFIEKAVEDPDPETQTAEHQHIKQPERYWEIQLAWSEYKRKKWLPKQITKVSFKSNSGRRPSDREGSRRRHLFYAMPDAEGLSVYCFYYYQVEYPYSYFPPVIRSGWKGAEFRFTGCGGEVFLKDSWMRTILTVRGTKPEAMYFVEENTIGLYLPKSLTTAEDGVVLRTTPGSTPFSILHPHQDASLTGRRPFFFQDDTKTYFITPDEVTIKTTTWKSPELVNPALIDQTRVKYYLQTVEGLKVIPGVASPAMAVSSMALVAANAPAVTRVEPSSLAPSTSGIMSIVSREVSQILNPVWAYTAPVISVSRRERRYRFHMFFHPHQCLFTRRLNRDGLDGFFRRDLQLMGRAQSPNAFEGRYSPTDLVMKTGPQGQFVLPTEDVDFSYTGAYSQYNWEIFFHAPLLIARKLSQNQRFEEAQHWFHYIFDPTDISSDDVPQKYWRTRPFYETSREDYRDQQIQNILKRLASDTPDPELERQVSEWRDSPFNPHLIARLRGTAYQKTVVMKYLDNLIAWGDQLFRRDTIESINEATQLYVLAADILGRRPAIIPVRAKPTVQTYNSLDPKISDFANRLVQTETLVVAPSLDNLPTGGVDADRPPLNWPPVSYFCVTPNDKLLGYWDTVADRLFKIRHCMNIEGVVRQLPLFEPPIEPGLLVRAMAAGIDISSILSDANAPLPPYRFNVLIQKATELCTEVKALGGALLAALEKRDAEELAQLRSSHEIALLAKVREVRQKQKDEAYAAWEGLKRSRRVTEAKRDYYRDIEERIEEERQHLSNLETAATFQTIGQGIEILAGALALIPDVDVGIAGAFGSPRVGATFGGTKMSTAVQVASRSMSLLSAIYNHMATKASIEGGFKRRWSDWKLQETVANRELDQIDKQIEAADIRWQITDQEVKNHDLQIENAKVVDEFLRNKYTNRELYDWMISQIAGLYFQAYQLAYDIAKRAERAYRYELGLDDSGFIKFGYWDSLKRGLLAGERLHQDIKRLEMAYLDQNRREYEITRHVSLAMLDPLALLRLRETGVCYVDVPESLYDMDYPGHYMRRLKSVSLTIPCVTGPYTGVQCTLTMLRNSVRQVSTPFKGKYERSAETEDPRFRDGVGATQSIVTSSAQNDSGLFELNFRDERYLPFEGAGAISSWRIELAQPFKPFDYSTIPDVVLHLRYTAHEGGEALKVQVVKELQDTVNQMVLAESKRGLFRWFNLQQEFPSEWYRFLNSGDPATGDHVQAFALSQDRFPYLFRGKRFRITGVHLIAMPGQAPLQPFDVYLTPSGATVNDTNDRITLELDPTLAGLPHKFKSYQGQEKEPGEGWRLRIKAGDLENPATILKDLAVVFQYNVEGA